ncbi:GDSL-type esterase/lipase family protein [Cytobacillus firmus]|uniref:SGNH/GDSL hydrolase family protein n=1 Tax=Cytobacillus firmus TaxID=1399 RepID=UPI0021C5725E|nr:GDSL-type esterase/lipase family protein [Cytobacillus firmus]MCU1807114.1 GDSL-type esterase/lipase family protein [Cytobacillus firmus]
MIKEIRIAIVGDSISQGLGSKLYNYSDELKKNIELQTSKKIIIKNFAFTGTTIKYANQISGDVKSFNPDIILSFYGNVDAMVRPKTTGKPNYYSLLPNRYKQNGMLDPRPFFSSKLLKRFFEHIDSYIRYNLKKLLMKLQGTYCWVGLEEFRLEYQEFLDNIISSDRKIFLVSTVIVDGFYFPGTNENYFKYNKCIKDLASRYNSTFLDVYNLLSKYEWSQVYGNDHFHPNLNGYTILAEYFAEELSKYIISNPKIK